jgi:hypothetical protein
MKYADWPTKDQAAKLIGVSVKTLERYADDNKLEQKLRSRPGGSPIAVFNPRDVERMASERAAAEGQPFVMPARSESETVPALHNAAIAPYVKEQLDALAAAVKPDALHVALAEKPRVTMTEAIALGFTRENLREMVENGKLENVGTPHRYRFRRRDLDAL